MQRPTSRPITVQSIGLTAEKNVAVMLDGILEASELLSGDDFDFLSLEPDAPVAPQDPARRNERSDHTATEIAQKLFNKDAVEAASATRVTFRLRAADLCEGDADCARFLQDVPLRLKVTSPREGDLDVVVMIGQAQRAPVTVRLHEDRIAVEVDLGQAKAVIDEIGPLLGEDFPTPDVMSGRLVAALERSAPQDFTASLSAMTAVEIQVTTPAGLVRLEMARSDPGLAARMNIATKELTLNTDLGAIDITAPAELLSHDDRPPAIPLPQDSEGAPTEPGRDEPNDGIEWDFSGTLAVHVPALRLAANIRAGEQVVRLRGENLGQESGRVALDGRQLLSVTFAAATGDELDVEVRPTERGARIVMQPGVDVSAEIDLRSIVKDLSDLPAWLQNDRMNLRLDGAPQPEVEIAPAGDNDVLAKVIAGALSLSSRAASAPVTVTSGSCLVPREGVEQTRETHPLDLVHAGTCP